MRTRAQQDMELAEKLVGQVAGLRGDVKQIYGGLCHSFPVMVRTCGLCQAIAFSRAKAGEDKDSREKAHALLRAKAGERKDPRKEAHELLLEHVAKVLDVQGDLLTVVRDASASDYMLYTRRILSAWLYFKRFAESILKVSSAATEGGD